MNVLMELLMYIFVIMGMITVIICIFEKQIYRYLSKENIKKDNTIQKNYDDNTNKY